MRVKKSKKEEDTDRELARLLKQIKDAEERNKAIAWIFEFPPTISHNSKIVTFLHYATFFLLIYRFSQKNNSNNQASIAPDLSPDRILEGVR